MKPLFSHPKIRPICCAIAATGMVIVSAISPMASSIASAATPPASAPTAAPARDPNARLERLFKTEQRVLANEERRLTRLNNVADKLQNYIDAQAKKQKDITELQAALDTFKKAISTAQADHDAAKAIIDVHDGFGPNGEVLDAAKARTTVQTAGKDEREFRQTVSKALRELWKAVREYRQANKS